MEKVRPVTHSKNSFGNKDAMLVKSRIRNSYQEWWRDRRVYVWRRTTTLITAIVADSFVVEFADLSFLGGGKGERISRGEVRGFWW